MNIELKNYTVREIFEGYVNNEEEGVFGFSGKLNIRPKYQREFIYKGNQLYEVIRTVLKGLPLNVMYWCKNEDGSFEVMDGQQRTLALCEYIAGKFSVDEKYFENLPSDIQNKILDYQLFIYVCEGTDSEKLDWFQIINIAGETLTNQELRNAVYSGPWITSAKKYFSKSNCPAKNMAGDYLSGEYDRQAILEKVLKWASSAEGKTINAYMSEHQFDETAEPLWEYFKEIFEWVESIFQVKRKKLMAGQDWGSFYNEYKGKEFNPEELESEIQRLLEYGKEESLTSEKGIYPYLITGQSKYLSVRAFSEADKQFVYDRQRGHCPMCTQAGDNAVYQIEEMEADHIVPWHKGGKTVRGNCQMLCKHHNKVKNGF